MTLNRIEITRNAELDRRSLSRRQRSAARVRVLAEDSLAIVSTLVAKASDDNDRLERLRALVVVASKEYARRAGPARAVALHGAQAGRNGKEIKRPVLTLADPWAKGVES